MTNLYEKWYKDATEDVFALINEKALLNQGIRAILPTVLNDIRSYGFGRTYNDLIQFLYYVAQAEKLAIKRLNSAGIEVENSIFTLHPEIEHILKANKLWIDN